MGIFETYGVSANEVAEPTFAAINPGVYVGQVLNDEIVHGSKEDPDYMGFLISYQLDGVPFPIQERFGLPKTPAPWDNQTVIGTRGGGNNPQPITQDSQNRWLMGLLKQRLLALGVPEDRINSLEPGQLTGIPVVVKLVKNGEYTNVARGPEGAKAKPQVTSTLPVATSPVAQANTAQTAFNPAWGQK